MAMACFRTVPSRYLTNFYLQSQVFCDIDLRAMSLEVFVALIGIVWQDYPFYLPAANELT